MIHQIFNKRRRRIWSGQSSMGRAGVRAGVGVGVRVTSYKCKYKADFNLVGVLSIVGKILLL